MNPGQRPYWWQSAMMFLAAIFTVISLVIQVFFR